MFASFLPTETWILIISFLDPNSLRTISGVSNRYYLLSNDPKHWKRICITNGISIPLIEDLSTPSGNSVNLINWKQVYLRAIRIQQQNLFFDLLIRKTSDETLFGSGLNRVLDTALEPIVGETCEQCREERSVLQVSCRQASRILWDVPAQPRSFLDHTLKIGCDWSQMSSRSRVPREFLLDYNVNNSLEQSFDLETLRLVEEQY